MGGAPGTGGGDQASGAPAAGGTVTTAAGPAPPSSATARRGLLASTARTLGALGLLSLAAPFTLALTGVALLRTATVRPPRRGATRRRTILLSGGKMTKALALARAFHDAGHRVVLVETRRYRLTGHRFSRAVDAFHVVPEPDAPGYAAALLAVVEAEGVDVYVPVCSPLASRHDARAAEVLGDRCEVFSADADLVARLDDKREFSLLAESLGLPVPESHRITDPQQVIDFDFAAGDPEARYVLKSIPYDPVHRLDLTRVPCATPEETAAFVRSLPISEEQPFVMQRFVAGAEYCTHTTARDGATQVYGCCASSASQLNYAMVDKPEIEAWVRRFVGELGITGQVSFDFIESADGDLRAIECNPRTHSAITMFYDHPDLARAYLEHGVPTVVPTARSRPTYWLYQELWRALRHPLSLPARVRTIVGGKDAIFDWADPLPFLLVHHLQIPALLLGTLVRGRPWIRIDVNIGKLVEPGGD